MYLSCDRTLVEVVPYCKSTNSAHWLHLHVNTSDQRVSFSLLGAFTYFAVFLACVETLLLTSSIYFLHEIQTKRRLDLACRSQKELLETGIQKKDKIKNTTIRRQSLNISCRHTI